MFRVGQKVVCIHDTWRLGGKLPLLLRIRHWLAGGDTDPVKHEIYTVQSIDAEPTGLWLTFDELRNPKVSGLAEARYHARCFRPLVENRTDISVFTAMLTGKRKTVGA